MITKIMPPYPHFVSADTKARLSLGFLILCLFAFFRPLTTTIHHIGSVNILDVFGLAISFLMILAVLPALTRLELRAINLMAFMFIGYSVLSLAWGSDVRETVRVILPFIPFFLVQDVVKSQKHIRILLIILIMGYSFPIVANAAVIALGMSPVDIDYHSGISRFRGLTTGAHALGHMMMFFSFVAGLFLITGAAIKRYQKAFLLILLLLSLYCVYATNTRTVYLGVLLFWFFFLWFYNKKFFVILLLVCLLIGTIYSEPVQRMITRADQGKRQTHSADYVTSGRFSLWDHNIKLFGELPVWNQMLGLGYGNEGKPVVSAATRNYAVSSHNDYLSLLMVSGIIGLSLYLLIQLIFFINVFQSPLSWQLKCFFAGFVVTVAAMNFASNSYVNRFPLAQLYWLYAGLFYAMSNMAGSNELIY